jgi:TetR/AcrR family transcriptional regulator, regulator of autoinduction and epiphytic fitness
MSDNVKPRRVYRPTKRAEQVAATRRAIEAAAGVLFRRHGYRGASMPAIADEAGVAVETIYRAFGSKAGLFRAVIASVVAGGSVRAETLPQERPAIRAVIEERDPRRQVARYAATQPGIHRRSGPLLRALAGGAATDPELAGLWAEIEAERLQGQGRLVDRLDARGALRRNLSVEDARDGLWTLCSLAVRDMLVETRGWSDERYLAWLTRALQDLLLDP